MTKEEIVNAKEWLGVELIENPSHKFIKFDLIFKEDHVVSAEIVYEEMIKTVMRTINQSSNLEQCRHITTVPIFYSVEVRDWYRKITGADEVSLYKELIQNQIPHL